MRLLSHALTLGTLICLVSAVLIKGTRPAESAIQSLPQGCFLSYVHENVDCQGTRGDPPEECHGTYPYDDTFSGSGNQGLRIQTVPCRATGSVTCTTPNPIDSTVAATNGYCGSGGIGDCDPEDEEYCINNGGAWEETLCLCDPDSPVLVDVAGNGFDLTDVNNGVRFDLRGEGLTKQLSWTRAGSDDAWLALDLNDNGTIDNGKELFGTFTFQPNPPRGEQRNGFLALAEYDKPIHGGNADGQINKSDSVFTSLRLWTDLNHNGTSESPELASLDSLSLKSIDLAYKPSKRIDEYGNRFKYRSKVRSLDSQVGRWAWDVFLVVDR